MRFAALLATVTIAATSVVSSPTEVNIDLRGLGIGLSPANKYGAPIPPWKPNAKPGWYYGNHPQNFPQFPCLNGGIICKLLSFYNIGFFCPKPPPPPPPHHPPPPPPHTTTHTTTTTSTTPTPTPTPPPPPPADGYTQTFSNITAAVQADDYMTFGLVDTVADCKTMCNSVAGCNFVNTYHDVNGKDGSTQLSCSLFTGCHDASAADNAGGQTQPDGSVDFIINSDGWCKSS